MNPFVKSKVIGACIKATEHIKALREQAVASLDGETSYAVISCAKNWNSTQYVMLQEILTVANKLGPFVVDINLSTKEFNAIAEWYEA